MLRDLYVRNLAVLAEASVELGPGLNVLTGETGAGKSIVVDALSLLAGGRASGDLIRSGADSLVVTGAFAPTGEGWRDLLAEAGVEVSGPEVVVRREISREGRNRVFVNDQPVTLRLLSDLAPFLLTIHGQRDELGLVSPDRQREWLDRSGGEEAPPLQAAVAAAWERWQRLRERLEHATGDQAARRERAELLRFQLDEIDRAGVRAGEEVELRGERDVLRHAEAIREALAGALHHLSEDDGAAAERVRRAQEGLEGIAAWDPGAAEWAQACDGIQIQLQEATLWLGRRLDEVEADPGRLDAVEERLASLERLFRRFGDGSDAVLARREELASELGEIDQDAAGRERLAVEVAAAREEYADQARRLTAARLRWARDLTAGVLAHLADLALPNVRFRVSVEPRRREEGAVTIDDVAVDAGPSGVDQVTLELAANPGEELAPLARVASGGELARVYLALQLAVRGGGEASRSTMVFDEVDAGVGGREAAAVGQKLRRLASGGQILSVTHLPQVASCAHHHFRISKRVEGGRTFTAVETLGEPERVEEVARMLAGQEVTAASRQHARELLQHEGGG